MADIYSTISIVAFILAVVVLIASFIIFFTMNVRETYIELRGQTDKDWVTKQQKKQKKIRVKGERITVPGKDTKNTYNQVEDEGITVLDSGEEVTEAALVGVYEPGTDVMNLPDEEKTEIETLKSIVTSEVEEESMTTIERDSREFNVTRREVYLFSAEIIR